MLYGAIGGKEWITNELRPTPVEELIGGVTCPVLGVFGEADHIISVDDVVRFRNSLEQSRKRYHIRLYPGAPHGWLNDTMPGRYRKEAATDAWSLMMAFLKKCFTGGWNEERISGTFESDFSAGLVSQPATGAERVAIGTPSRGLFEFPAVVAIRKGYYKDEGIEVDKVQMQPAIAVKALISGDIDYLLAWGSAVLW